MSRSRSLAAAPALNALVPAGVYLPFGGATAPTGWLSCDGTAVSRSTYAGLFAAIGTTYGSGDGSTTFNLPNMSDRTPVGKSGTRNLGTTGGASSVTPSGSVANTTLAESQMPAHRHGLGDGSNFQPANGGIDDNNFSCPASGDAQTAIRSFGESYITQKGSSGAHNHGLSMSSISVEQPWVCCHYIIKF